MKKIEQECRWHYDGDFETVEKCALCNSINFKIDYFFSQQLGLIDPFKCNKCSTCNLRWLSPRPTQAGYQTIYTMNNYFGGDNSQEFFPSIEKSRELLFSRRLKSIRKHCMTTSRKKSILDIGAATGQFVHKAACSGYDATGIELSKEAREEAKRRYSVSISGDTLEELNEKGLSFDVIHMNHVFEHFMNPNECLEQCRQLLKEEGILIIEVPQQFDNDLDKMKKILRKEKKPSFTPYSLHHAFFYTPATLNMMLEKHNFSAFRVRTSNFSNTPIVPFSLRNLLLGIFLAISDNIHRGGNIIEVFSRKI